MSAKKKILIGLVAAIAVLGVGAVVLYNLIRVDGAEDAGVLFKTEQSSRPDNGVCLDQDGGTDSAAKELINIVEAVVVTNNGAPVMSDDEWNDYAPLMPWVKNRDRTKLFDGYCLYRSPEAPSDCEGEDCRVQRELGGFEWLEASLLLAQDCLPSPAAGCGPTSVRADAISLNVYTTCVELTFTSEVFELSDPDGNRFAMHETESDTPDLNPALPEGWSLNRVSLDEPLVILPSGGDDACFHNIARDNLGQGYHQFEFVYDSYPPSS